MPLYIQFGVLDINECSRRLERECIRDPSCVRYLSLGWYLFMNRQRPCQFMKHWPGFTNPSQSIRYPLLHPIALYWLDNWYLSSLLTRSPFPMFLINWVRTITDHRPQLYSSLSMTIQEVIWCLNVWLIFPGYYPQKISDRVETVGSSGAAHHHIEAYQAVTGSANVN